MSLKYKSAPPIKIDLRNKFPEIRDQGRRPLCLAFATSDQNAFIQNEKEALSVEYLSYYSYREAGETDFTQGLTCQSVAQALKNYGQPYEVDAPYDESALKPTLPSRTPAKLFHAVGKERVDIVDDLIVSLDKGISVVVIVTLCSGFFNPNTSNVIDDDGGNAGNHALIIVGYGRYADNEPCFLVRNSWGLSWASKGYAWLTSQLIEKRVILSLRLSVKP